MRISRILTSLLLLFSVQISGIQYVYSATIAVPTNITVRASTNTAYLNGSVTVSWDYVAGATAYAVMATRAGSSAFSTVSVSGERNSQAVVSGLVGGATYAIQVRTIQDQEASAWSSNSLTSTPTTLPKGVDKPTVTAEVGKATITWIPLTGNEDGGSAITSYLISESNSGKSISASGTASSIDFNDLEQGAAAIFRVSAISAVSTSGATSVASDEVTILSADNVEVQPSASPTPSAQPTSPIEVTSGPTSAPSSGGSGGGTISFGGGGGGGAIPPPLIPSPPSTVSPSPSPSPKPSTVIPPENTPLLPSSSPSPTTRQSTAPTKSATPSPSGSSSLAVARTYLVTTNSKSNVTAVSLKNTSSTLTVSAAKNLSISLPTQKKGSKVIVKVRTPTGAILPVTAITTSKAGVIKLPTLDFKKTGLYQMVISINGKISTLKITVKK
jgi:outer membrane biosynthesis protein TonB